MLSTLLVLSVLIIVHEFGHFIVAKKMKVRVEKFSLGFGPKIIGRKKGDTEYTLCAIPLGGYVKMAGDNIEEFKGDAHDYLAKPLSCRAAIILFGPLLNYVFGILCFWVVFTTGYPTLGTKIGGLREGFGAKEAGVQVGDKITAVDGQKIMLWEDFQKIIQAKKESMIVKLSILRGGRESTLNVNIREIDGSDLLGQRHRIGVIGIMPSDEIIKIKHGLTQSFILSLNKTWDLTAITYNALWRMITGKLSLRDSVTGPVGIFKITSEAAHKGISQILLLVAILSTSLAIFNLLPFPVLDGGHIFLLIVEKIRGRSISVKTEQVITQVGMSMLILLAVVVTYNDILRFFGDRIARLFGR